MERGQIKMFPENNDLLVSVMATFGLPSVTKNGDRILKKAKPQAEELVEYYMKIKKIGNRQSLFNYIH